MSTTSKNNTASRSTWGRSDSHGFTTGMGTTAAASKAMSTMLPDELKPTVKLSTTMMKSMPSLKLYASGTEKEMKVEETEEEKRLRKKYCGQLAHAEFFRYYKQIQKERQHFTQEQVGGRCVRLLYMMCNHTCACMCSCYKTATCCV